MNKIKINHEKKIFQVKINFRHLPLFLFLVFGFYGWGTSGGLDRYFSKNELLILLSLLVAMLSIWKSKELINTLLKNEVTFKLKHLYALTTFFIILILFNTKKIGRDLTGDELSYALNSVEHSLGILERLFDKLPSFIQNLPASQSVQLISILINF
jgi:hypothetical protein